ncbi:MAG: ParB/RepB/Spo0J family partition protein [Pyrinomonadaceae bacterium]
MARKPLGRGLSALLGEEPIVTTDGIQGEVDIDLIEPNPEQPRTRFVDANLDELARSINANGIVQPIVVRKVGTRYQIIAGERRWRAAQRAGLRKVPVTVKDIADEKLLEIALVENIQRQELNPVEEAKAYRKLIDTIGFTQEELAERVGKERSRIASSMRILKLPQDIQTLIEEEKLSAGHGRALLMSDDTATQRRIARSIVELGLSVREAERMIKKAASKAANVDTTKVTAATKDPNARLAETKMMRALGTNVKIVPGRKGGGKIEVEYYNTDDLDRIFQRIVYPKEG